MALRKQFVHSCHTRGGDSRTTQQHAQGEAGWWARAPTQGLSPRDAPQLHPCTACGPAAVSCGPALGPAHARCRRAAATPRSLEQ